MLDNQQTLTSAQAQSQGAMRTVRCVSQEHLQRLSLGLKKSRGQPWRSRRLQADAAAEEEACKAVERNAAAEAEARKPAERRAAEKAARKVVQRRAAEGFSSAAVYRSLPFQT